MVIGYKFNFKKFQQGVKQMKEYPDMVGGVDFNYHEDNKEFGTNSQRKITLSACVDEEGIPKISISFELGRKAEDTITLSFDTEEFMQKISRAIVYGDNYERH